MAKKKTKGNDKQAKSRRKPAIADLTPRKNPKGGYASIRALVPAVKPVRGIKGP